MKPRVSHPLAGKTVRLRADIGPPIAGAEFRVEDWFINVAGESWSTGFGNPACLQYAIRTGLNRDRPTPLDDEVLCGKVGPIEYLVHESEIGGVIR